jgi:hypothetical protein
MTWNSEQRLPRLLRQIEGFADEIVVGVDTASIDGTYKIAEKHADVIFQFEHMEIVEPALMLPLEYSNREWILLLADDELVDEAFQSLLPDLLESEYTHFWFPCKWVVDLEPLRYLRAPPWFPDWQLRLFRNDKKLVWHPKRVHTSYQVMGMGRYENRTCILHYALVNQTEETRRDKLARYRKAGSEVRFEEYYFPTGNVNRAAVEAPPRDVIDRTTFSRKPRRIVFDTHRVSELSSLPPWKASLDAELPSEIRSGSHIFVRIRAINDGVLCWSAIPNQWPHLNISYHIRDDSGRLVVWDGDRTSVTPIVEPGGIVSLMASFTAPREPGEYLVEWDMVSEGECWFAECGSPTAIVPVRIVPEDRSAK